MDTSISQKMLQEFSISAFTRRATNNIRRNVSEDFQPNCITIHKLLEYEPQFYTEYDAEKDKEVNKMSFEPARNESNPLPESLVCIAMEESSMIGTELFKEIENANPHNPQYIFLGDIQQLPPVFGQAVLGFKMLELPVVELTEVYRQAFDSPILRLAHRILSGKPIEKAELLSSEWQVPGKLKIHPWQKKISAESAVLTLAKFFIRMLDEKEYDPKLMQSSFHSIKHAELMNSISISRTRLQRIRRKPFGKLSTGLKRVTSPSAIRCSTIEKMQSSLTFIQSNLFRSQSTAGI
jgi:hypothetical protein